MFHRIAAIGLASALVLFLTVTSSNQAAAGEIEDFYSGKTITIYIGYGFGGTYGKYSRTMAKHLTKHIPGHPKLIVKSMPGAGGIKMTNFAYNAMPKNGYHFLVPPDASVVSQLLRPKKVRYKAQDFTWIGATNQTNTIFVLRKDTGVKKWQDLRTIPVISGNTGPGVIRKNPSWGRDYVRRCRRRAWSVTKVPAQMPRDPPLMVSPASAGACPVSLPPARWRPGPPAAFWAA